MKTIKISNLQEGDVFMYKGVMYEIVHKDKWETYFHGRGNYAKTPYIQCVQYKGV